MLDKKHTKKFLKYKCRRKIKAENQKQDGQSGLEKKNKEEKNDLERNKPPNLK